MRCQVTDEGSSNVIGFVIAAALFLVTSGIMFAFTSSPVANSGMSVNADLSSRATNALSLLVDSRGVPESWGATSSGADTVSRLGLGASGTVNAIDAKKFDALSKGTLTGTSADGAVDYADAVKALGLGGSSFHLSAYPAFLPNPAGTYGLAGMETFHVAYVGHYSGNIEQTESQKESAAIADLPLWFDNSLYNGALPVGQRGDKYKDDSQFLRADLVPLLGSTLLTSHNGTGVSPTYTWGNLNATELAATAGMTPHSGIDVLATGDGTTLAYSKNANERTVVGIANLTGMSSPTVTFYEYVNGQGTELTPATSADYGVVEVSLDGGTTWSDLTPTYDTGLDHPSVQSAPGVWRTRTVDFSHCRACAGNPEVYVAFRWVSNSDSTVGRGWVIDDVTVSDAVNGLVAFTNNFEGPYYDALVIGSDVSQSAMTPAELKYAIRDYVLAGGKLYVLGGQQNVQWLQPLFSAGIASGAGPAFAPDATNPFLTVPNQLSWRSYANNGMYWQITNGCTTCFYGIVTGGTGQYTLTANTQNAFGDGLVALTTWLPFSMQGNEAQKFFANAFVYGKYHYLYLEYGPPVPPGVPVASASRTAIMDRTRDMSGVYTEMRFILYAWQ
ncbi:MAG: hypothetical protein ACYDCK_05455 [Thermoplasmatota archaeon]